MKGIRWLMALMIAGAVLAAATGCSGRGTAEQSTTPEAEEESVSADVPASAEDSEDVSDRETYDSTVTYTADASIDGAEYVSTGTDENAIVIESGNVSFKDITVTRDSSDSAGGDEASFYGVGAAILAKGGTTKLENAQVATDARGGAGMFAYGEGIVEISDSTISTMQDTSGGIHVAGGGTLRATNVTATTEGESSAAVRSDRGGGLMVVDGGTYTSNGIGSPAVYCTATIAARNASLEATGSEAVCIEGLNSLYLYDCDLTGSMQDLSQNDCTWNVILYQSMSGDSEVGNSTFQMSGGTLTAKNGGMFCTTNTESTFVLNDVEIVCAEDSEFFLRCTGNNNERGWGRSGDNGADCTFTAMDQEMDGNVIWDTISNLDFYMSGGSILRGAFLQDESYAGNGGEGYANLYIGEGSQWIVTMDSMLSALHNAGTIVDGEGNAVSVRGMDGTEYVSGTSQYTIVVDSYDTAPDLAAAGTITAFEDAQVNTGSAVPDGSGGMPGEGETPPEMPDGVDGEMVPPDSEAAGEMPPEKPDGGTGQEMPPDMSAGRPGRGEEPPQIPEGMEGQQPPSAPDAVADGDGPPAGLDQGGGVS